MRLGVKPAVFLARLLVFFFATYVLWKPVAPLYTHLLATLTRGFLHLTELSTDPRLHQVTEMSVRETKEGRPAIFFQHRLAPSAQSGIPAEWVQANLVLLIPLMLATPARTYGQRFGRLGLALGVALALQVLDISVTVKSLYAHDEVVGQAYGDLARWLYQFGDAFTQAMDTQLFPFTIWAGIHFNQLLGRDQAARVPPPVGAAPAQSSGRKAGAPKKAGGAAGSKVR